MLWVSFLSKKWILSQIFTDILHEEVIISKPIYKWEWMPSHWITVYGFKWCIDRKRPQLWSVFTICSTYRIMVPCFCGTYSSPYLHCPEKCIRSPNRNGSTVFIFFLANVLTWYILCIFLIIIQRSFCSSPNSGPLACQHSVSCILIYLNYVHIFTH